MTRLLLFLIFVLVPIHSFADTSSSVSPIIEKQAKKKKKAGNGKVQQTKRPDVETYGVTTNKEENPLVVMTEEEFSILQKRNKDDGYRAKRKPMKPVVTRIEKYLESEGRACT